MTTDEKLMALKSITSTHLEMRSPGDWYVRAYDRDASRGMMLHGIYGNGSTPQEAIEDDWKQVSTEPKMKSGDRYFRWNGYMWEDVK